MSLSASKLQEVIVAALEERVSKQATVKHDVFLPVLGSKSERTRQVDVAIYQGEPPRQTLSIVEVQKRGKKPEINEFGGWLEKMREVGAQHLLCVSETGFPDSVVEKARETGPSVRLLTLRQLVDQEFEFPNEVEFGCQVISIPRIFSFQAIFPPGHKLYPSVYLPTWKKCLVLSDGTEETPTEFVDKCVMWRFPELSKDLTENEKHVRVVTERGGMCFKGAGGELLAPKQYRFEYLAKADRVQAEWEHYEYKQEDFGPLIWCAIGTVTIPDAGALKGIVTFEESSPGNYQSSPINVLDASEDLFPMYLQRNN